MERWDAFHLQSTRQHTMKQFGSQKQQLSVMNDKVIAQARSILRTQIYAHHQASLILSYLNQEGRLYLGDQRCFGVYRQ